MEVLDDKRTKELEEMIAREEARKQKSWWYPTLHCRTSSFVNPALSRVAVFVMTIFLSNETIVWAGTQDFGSY